MRILLVSDLHYTLRQLDWVVEASAEYDLVVVAGDSLDIGSLVPLEAQCEVVLQYLYRLAGVGRVVISSGNHDLTGDDIRGERAALWLSGAREAGIPTDGDSLTVDDALLTICPWWDGPLGRAAVEEQLRVDSARRPRWWLWTYHWPPSGSPTCWTGRREYGDPDLAGWIQGFGPEIVLTGHVHESPFTPEGAWADRVGGAWVFNAGRQRGPEPAHVVIDLGNQCATWVSQAGVERLDMGTATAPARTAV